MHFVLWCPWLRIVEMALCCFWRIIFHLLSLGNIFVLKHGLIILNFEFLDLHIWQLMWTLMMSWWINVPSQSLVQDPSFYQRWCFCWTFSFWLIKLISRVAPLGQSPTPRISYVATAVCNDPWAGIGIVIAALAMSRSVVSRTCKKLVASFQNFSIWLMYGHLTWPPISMDGISWKKGKGLYNACQPSLFPHLLSYSHARSRYTCQDIGH